MYMYCTVVERFLQIVIIFSFFLSLISEMVRRFEEAPPFSRHVILQLMRPWLRNIELVEEIPRIQTSVMLDHALPSLVASKSTNPVLSGSGWGSLEGTHLVLHNLLYLTTKVEIYMYMYMYMYGACNILLFFF